MLEFVQITYLIIHLRLLLLVIDVGYFQCNEVIVTFRLILKGKRSWIALFHCVFSKLNKPFFNDRLYFSLFFYIISIWLCYLCWWLIILNLIKKRESFLAHIFKKQQKFTIPLISSKNLIAFQNIINSSHTHFTMFFAISCCVLKYEIK